MQISVAGTPAQVREIFALDRLALVNLIGSLYFVQLWSFRYYDIGDFNVSQALIVMSLAGVVLPRLSVILGINCVLFLGLFVLASPVASNNQTTAAAFSAIVFLSLYHRGWWSLDPEARDGAFRAIAGPGRWILAGMYFYGIYHKINVDFLDPEVSCAVVLYRTLAGLVSLENWSFGHYGAIYSTFIIEAIAMVALFFHRLKFLGFAVGIPFHVIIGFTGYAYYKDFSTIVLVLYALFLPRSGFDHVMGDLSARAGGRRVAFWGLTLVLAVFAGAYAYLAWPGGLRTSHELFMPFFGIYCAAFYVFALSVLARTDERDPSYGFTLAAVIPILFFRQRICALSRASDRGDNRDVFEPPCGGRGDEPPDLRRRARHVRVHGGSCAPGAVQRSAVRAAIHPEGRRAGPVSLR